MNSLVLTDPTGRFNQRRRFAILLFSGAIRINLICGLVAFGFPFSSAASMTCQNRTAELPASQPSPRQLFYSIGLSSTTPNRFRGLSREIGFRHAHRTIFVSNFLRFSRTTVTRYVFFHTTTSFENSHAATAAVATDVSDFTCFEERETPSLRCSVL